jgi:acyl carrier protein
MPTTTSQHPTTQGVAQPSVEAAIVELLAQALSQDPDALRQELRTKGQELPVDSLLLVEILCDLEARFAVRLPEDNLTAASLRSVSALARRVCQIASQSERADA